MFNFVSDNDCYGDSVDILFGWEGQGKYGSEVWFGICGGGGGIDFGGIDIWLFCQFYDSASFGVVKGVVDG